MICLQVLVQLKKCIDLIGNRTRDFLACSVVPHSAATTCPIFSKVKKKHRAISVGGVETLRIPHFLDSRLIDGGRVVSPTHRPHFTLQIYFSASDTHLC
jgi:hypothetical protein